MEGNIGSTTLLPLSTFFSSVIENIVLLIKYIRRHPPKKNQNIQPEEKLKYVELAAIRRQEYEKAQADYLNTLLEKYDVIRQYEMEKNGRKVLIDHDGRMLKKSHNKKQKLKKNTIAKSAPTAATTTTTTTSSSSPPPLTSQSIMQLVTCTVCGNYCGIFNGKNKYKEHPVLGVPVCAPCSAIYESGEFTISEEDNHEIYCRCLTTVIIFSYHYQLLLLCYYYYYYYYYQIHLENT
jgi:hypothetical protein